jgi:hypothetical protein
MIRQAAQVFSSDTPYSRSPAPFARARSAGR